MTMLISKQCYIIVTSTAAAAAAAAACHATGITDTWSEHSDDSVHYKKSVGLNADDRSYEDDDASRILKFQPTAPCE